MWNSLSSNREDKVKDTRANVAPYSFIRLLFGWAFGVVNVTVTG